MQSALGLLIGPPVVAAFTWILQHTGPWVPLYLWAFFFALQLFFMSIYPSFIAPLFNKFSPLEAGPLRCARACMKYALYCGRGFFASLH
jgi:STE24 endopeptidase